MPPRHPSSDTGYFRRKWHRLSETPKWGAVTETRVLATLLLLATSIYAFMAVADEVSEHETKHFDSLILRWFRDPHDMGHTIGPHWIQTAALDITALGGTTVLLLVVLITLGFLWIAKKRKAFLVVAVASLGGEIFNSALKGYFARPRPEIVPHLTAVHSTSFPSGHSMMSAVIYLTLGALISRLVKDRIVRAYIMGVSMFLTLSVGLTRVFLGVHYPTDVMAGWAAGLAWALICLLITRILQHAGKVEEPGEHTTNPLKNNQSENNE